MKNIFAGLIVVAVLGLRFYLHYRRLSKGHELNKPTNALFGGDNGEAAKKRK